MPRKCWDGRREMVMYLWLEFCLFLKKTMKLAGLIFGGDTLVRHANAMTIEKAS
jgi:hypothetical protein